MEKKQTVVALLQGSYYLSYFEHFEQKKTALRERSILAVTLLFKIELDMK